MTVNASTQRYMLLLMVFFAMHLGGWFAPWSTSAAEMPSYVRLGALTEQINAPTAVAVDGTGRLYVVQPGENNVIVLSQSGRHIRTITCLAEPVSVAVADDGTIFVGNRGQGNVEVYGPDFQPIVNNLGDRLQLGAGVGEFGNPKDIAFDGTGKIYVADKEQHQVKIYAPDGSPIGSIGSMGNGNGEFNHPISVAVDRNAGELVVLDLQQVQEIWTGEWIDGARIQVFNLTPDGPQFARSFSRFGSDISVGELNRPMHIEVDGQSRYFVSNCWPVGKIVVYDNSGAFLGLLDDPHVSLKTPLGIAIASTGRLYIASSVSQQLDVYGLGESYLAMRVAPLSLSFTGKQDDPALPDRTVTITNTGAATFGWRAVSNDPWLVLLQTVSAEELSPGATATVAVSIAEGLPLGTYDGEIVITAGGLASETVNVSLAIVPDYDLQVRPAALQFESYVGETPLFQNLTIENQGGGTLNWSAAADPDWISPSSAAGTAPSEIEVFVDTSFRPAGTYTGEIIVAAVGESNVGPVTVPVTLTLNERPPVEPPEVAPAHIAWPGDSRMKWQVMRRPGGESLHGIWGSSVSDILAVGDNGTALHFDGRKWSHVAVGTRAALYDICGSSNSDAYAVGDTGLILHFDGTDWTNVNQQVPATLVSSLKGVWRDAGTGTYTAGNNGAILNSPSNDPWQIMFYSKNIANLRGVWGSSDSDIFVVGDNGVILHYDGNTWSFMGSGVAETLHGVWGSSGTDIFAVGNRGTLLHFDGTGWNLVDSGTQADLLGIWGNSRYEVYAVGTAGTMLRYDGTSWHSVETGVDEQLNDVWSGKCNDIYAVGENGIIIHGHAGFPWQILRPALDYNTSKGEGDKSAD